MEQSWGKLDAEAATNLTEMMCMRRQGEAANRFCFTRQRLLPPAVSLDEEDAAAHIHVGCYYEIDHRVLPTRTPDQLKSIRVIMVSKKTKLNVSLRFPSLYSLRVYLRDEKRGRLEGKILPSLDEKYVMGSEFAGEVLYRRIPPHEISVQRNQWSFWVAPSIRKPEEKPLMRLNPNVNIEAKEPLLSELKSTGMIRWGKRRQVRFLRRHEEPQKELQITLVRNAEEEEGVKDEENEESDHDGDQDQEEEEEEEEKASTKSDKENVEWSDDESSEKVRNPQKRKNYPRRCSNRLQKFKKAKCEKQIQVIPSKQRKKKEVKKHISRWSVDRYKLAEKNILKIMKEKGAVIGKPILRPVLRTEARKLIGDTGLLDHLLKHMAGRVAPGGEERFRRRHNADGAMEYWLEKADLLNIRKEAGVQDPYWIPPPGWKLGDHPTQDPICARELKDLREEMTKLKREIQELGKKKQKGNVIIVATPDSSLVSDITAQQGSIILHLKEKYMDLMNKKAKVEEQLMEISQSLCEMEDDMVKLNSTGEQQNKLLEIMNLEKEKDAQSEDKAARRERLKSGFRICKPQGSFLWPNMTLSPQGAVQTPPSVSSSTASAPHCSTSPVKPSTEKQLVTVSSSPFPAILPPTDSTTATITTTKTTLINLNEIPGSHGSSILSHSTTSAVTYQRRHHTIHTATPSTSAVPHEKKEGCSASSPCKSVGAESWLALTN